MRAVPAILIFTIFGLLTMHVGDWITQNKHRAEAYESARRARLVAESLKIMLWSHDFNLGLSANQSTFDAYVRTSGFPVNTVLSGGRVHYVKGGTGVSTFMPGTLTDGVAWYFDRGVAYSTTSPDQNVASINRCGAAVVNAMVTETQWCGDDSFYWGRFETRERYSKHFIYEKRRQRYVLERFSNYYSANQKYPDPGSLSPVTLLSLMENGTPASLSSCAGPYTWKGMVFDCSDLFSEFGSPTMYQYYSTTSAVLFADSDILSVENQAVEADPQVVIATALEKP